MDRNSLELAVAASKRASKSPVVRIVGALIPIVGLLVTWFVQSDFSISIAHSTQAEAPDADCVTRDEFVRIVGEPKKSDDETLSLIKQIETERTRAIEAAGVAAKETTALQAALYKATTLARFNKTQRDAVELTRLTARARFGEYLRRGDSIEVASRKVLEEVGAGQ